MTPPEPWYKQTVRLAQAVRALEEALRKVEPDLHWHTTQQDDGQFQSVVALREGKPGPRMTLTSDLYIEVVDDPEQLQRYAVSIVEKLRKEKG